MKPAQYWRANKEWSKWIGRKGRVIAATLVHVSSPELASITPYSYVIVDFGKEKHEFMGVDHEVLAIDDEVECVLRKCGTPTAQSLIPYGIKVRKL